MKLVKDFDMVHLDILSKMSGLAYYTTITMRKKEVSPNIISLTIEVRDTPTLDALLKTTKHLDFSNMFDKINSFMVGEELSVIKIFPSGGDVELELADSRKEICEFINNAFQPSVSNEKGLVFSIRKETR